MSFILLFCLIPLCQQLLDNVFKEKRTQGKNQ
jgi:hypothetical protein